MTNMKKNIPLAIRELIQEIIDSGKDLCKAVYDKDCVLLLVDNDVESDYFFKIKTVNYDKSNGRTFYNIEFKPCSREHLNPEITKLRIAEVKASFNNWKKLLDESNKPFLLLEDNITQSYYDELEPNFEIIDEDALYKPFTIAQSKAISFFLDKVEEIISKEAVHDSDLPETLKLIDESKKTISKSTKKEVMQKIRRIIAKCFKMGIEIGEKLLIEFTAELTKKLMLGSGN